MIKITCSLGISDSSSSRTQGITLESSGSRSPSLAAAEATPICGVLAGVGARSCAGDLATPRSAWMRAGGLASAAAAAEPCSSLTLWRSALTWPRRSASPDPGVRRGLGRVLVAVAAGVLSWRLPPAARPTMGESLVMSCSAARVSPAAAAAFLGRAKGAAESAALFSVGGNQETRSSG